MSDEFEQIVRALAAIEDPTVDDRDYSPSADCGLCHAPEDPRDYKHWLDDPMKHLESCPWRMAKLLIERLDGTRDA